MSFYRKSGKPNFEEWPNTISQAYVANTLVYPDGSGAVIPADATSGMHIGLCLEDLTSSDARYTTAGKLLVDVLGDDDIFEADVDGTLTTAMVGNHYDLTDADSVNCAANSKKVVLCVGFISTTKGLFKLNAKATNLDVATT